MSQEGPSATDAMLNAVKKGADFVGGHESWIKKGLEIVFHKDIAACEQKIAGIKGEIIVLVGLNDAMELDTANQSLAAATEDFNKAQFELVSAKSTLMSQMQHLGRLYDRKHLVEKPNDPKGNASIEEEAELDAPGVTVGEKVSMEAVLALYAAVQNRGASRAMFKTMLEQCPTLPKAMEIARKSLATKALAPEGSDQEFLEIDELTSVEKYAGQQVDPAKHADAESLRFTATNITVAIAKLKEVDAPQGQVEAAWQQAIAKAGIASS